MKRLYIAAALLSAVAASCLLTHLYLHRQMDRMISALDRVEALYRAGDAQAAAQAAEDFSAEYQRICDRISCYVPHGDLQNSRETAAVLAALIKTRHDEELYTEIARLRFQLVYARQVDDPLLQNIL